MSGHAVFLESLRQYHVQQGTEVNAGRLHHGGESAVLCKSGDGVDFVEYQFARRRQEHIHSGETGTAESTIDVHRCPSYLPGHFHGDASGNVDSGMIQRVLFYIVEEIAGGLGMAVQTYFIRFADSQMMFADDGTAHLEAVDTLLYDDFIVVDERCFDGGGQVSCGGDLRYPQGRTGLYGFDEYRESRFDDEDGEAVDGLPAALSASVTVGPVYRRKPPADEPDFYPCRGRTM